ncbi:UMP kinase [Candidatus Saccharibacteria bacterium]|jgi:uridylate kinase|nr:MAG: UMP kinase [Candidatus Saccharibacteria bacterium]
MYKRVLLKVSGEQLAGEFDGGLDPKKGHWLAKEVRKVLDEDCQVIIMVGGGNYLRGAQIAGHGIKRVTADQMGMLATMMNALALTDLFEDAGISTRCLSTIFAQQLAEPFVHRLAEKHLKRGRVVIVAGGSGRPYVTTDTAAVILALELNCDAVLKSTKVDGVYDRDPTKFKDAKRYDKLSFQEAVENEEIKVMDKAAMGLAMEQHKPIVIFELDKPGNIARVVRQENVGTLIK